MRAKNWSENVRFATEPAWQYVDEWGKAVGASTPASALPSVYLHPGQLVVATQPMQVTTIVGSCVAVCLWDPFLSIGGTNHFLLPTGLKTSGARLKYGNIATEELVERLVQAGARVGRLRAKLFGGACVLEAMQGTANHLGQKNVQAAREALAKAGIPIVDEDVGGSHGRKLIYHPHEGCALVKLL